MKKNTLAMAAAAAMSLASTTLFAAELGDGEAANDRLDRKGDRIEERMDRRADRADRRGNEVKAERLDKKGDRIEERMDERGDRVDSRRGGEDKAE